MTSRRGDQRMWRRNPSGALLVRDPPDIVKSVTILEWWDSRAGISSSGGVVDTWTGNKGTVATGALTARPAYSASDASFGGLPSVTGDGVDDVLTTALAVARATTQPFYVWSIWRMLTWTVNAAIAGFGTGNPYVMAYCSASTPNLRAFGNANGPENANTSLTNARRSRTYYSGTAADSLTIGNVSATGAAGSTLASSGFTMFALGGGQFCNVALSQLIITIGKPTATEEVALDNWAIGLGYPAGVLT